MITRRLHFDLTGLPPGPDSNSDIKELLESPHYGERWARHWLDVARYGESNGFEYDQPDLMRGHIVTGLSNH